MLRLVMIMLALSGAMIGFATSLLLPRRYVGTASLSVYNHELVVGAADRTLSAQPLSAMIRDNSHYRQLLDYTPLPDVVQQVRDNTAIVEDPKGGCTVEFTDDDKYAAITMTNSLLNELRRNLQGAPVKEPLRIGTTGPSGALCTLEGLVGGLVVALCVGFGVARS